MTREEAIQAWEQMRSEIDKENWLFVGTINPLMIDMAIEALQADTVEVVRCKDCKHYKPFDKSKKFDCPQGLYAVFENDYCSHGERSEE